MSQKKCRGIALVTVLFVTALLAILVVGMFVAAQSEARSSDVYESTVRTDQLTEIAKSAVISQIRRGTQYDPEEGIAWASQPGALRAYSKEGFHRGIKLYSDSSMEVTEDEYDLATDAPPADWDTRPDHYVDLNAPVARTRGRNKIDTYFPIFDPRAFYDDPDTKADERVEGFSYSENAGEGDAKLNGVIVEDEDPEKLRLPMPVEWLYVLRDGTLGTLDEKNKFQPSKSLTEDNPLVGRIAFWTDDESSKININTASEPTYWATPSLGDRDDWGWAKIQPGAGEFQRFPGHPATTALSPVLFPNQRFADPPTPNQEGILMINELRLAKASADEKGKIYNWAPKIQDIGSRSGTEFLKYSGTKNKKKWIERSYWYDSEYDPFLAAREHLYASVDEYLFSADRSEHEFKFKTHEDTNSDGRRSTKASGKLEWNNEEMIRRARSFLTANSRSPETTLFGTPRIAMWPLHDSGNLKEGYRTHYDQLIARCATLGVFEPENDRNSNSYYFRRKDSEHSRTDIEIPRNDAILNYLVNLTSRPIPGFGESFASKYGDDREQILVEIFDYIRATNTFDPILASEGRKNGGDYKTYTAGRKIVKHKGQEVLDVRDGPSHFYNGHGHVVPSYSEKWDAKGLGRALTLDEVSMMFICCADGTPNDLNEYKDDIKILNPWKGGGAGILRGSKKNGSDTNGWAKTRTEQIVYSNFPPNPHDGAYGPKKNEDGTPNEHPGYEAKNWNYCLEEDLPMNPNQRRIQGMLLLDYFNIAPGYNPLMVRYGLRIKGLNNFRVNDEILYPMNEAEFWRTGGSADAHWGVGHGLNNKLVSGRPPMPEDIDPAEKIKNYNELVTNFIDVEGDEMTFGAVGPIEIEVVSQQKKNGPLEVIQTIVIEFPRPHAIPVPKLVLRGRPGSKRNPNIEKGEPSPPPEWNSHKNGDYVTWGSFHPQAPYFWSFYRKGYNLASSGRMAVPHAGKGREARPGQVWGYPTTGNYVFPHKQRDVVYSMVPWHGDYRITAATTHIEKDPESPYKGLVFMPIPGAPDAEEPNFGHYTFDHAFRRGIDNRNNGLGHGQRSNKKFKNDLYTENELAGLAWPTGGLNPHFPASEEATMISRRYGDFDIAAGKTQGGAFINKPDEGSLHGTQNGLKNGSLANLSQLREIPYFHSFWNTQETQDGFFSPNRMVSSPAILGSLPSGVKAQDPWRTLLFRPDVNSTDANGQTTKHPGAKSPPDHLLLDLFWMPVVEPYAISEPFSTAGKINLNYQILPFTYIRRATGLHGLLKGERIPSLPISTNPVADANFSRALHWDPAQAYNPNAPNQQWRGKYLYRDIDASETLEDFDKKFEEDFTLFRSASQICEMHLVPVLLNLPSKVNFDEGGFANIDADNDIRMQEYWKTHRGTSDNLRERPYSNLYSRTTTQTNTWQIHYRVQVLKKPRQNDISTFDSAAFDSVTGEQRGSILLERYIDPNDPTLPDFVEDPVQTLDTKYQFRVLSSRRFSL